MNAALLILCILIIAFTSCATALPEPQAARHAAEHTHSAGRSTAPLPQGIDPGLAGFLFRFDSSSRMYGGTSLLTHEDSIAVNHIFDHPNVQHSWNAWFTELPPSAVHAYAAAAGRFVYAPIGTGPGDGIWTPVLTGFEIFGSQPRTLQRLHLGFEKRNENWHYYLELGEAMDAEELQYRIEWAWIPEESLLASRNAKGNSAGGSDFLATTVGDKAVLSGIKLQFTNGRQYPHAIGVQLASSGVQIWYSDLRGHAAFHWEIDWVELQ